MEHFSITSKDASVRLDMYLRRFFPDRSRKEIAKAITRGSIIVNGRIVKPSYTTRENDSIECSFPKKEDAVLLPNAQIDIPILFENEQFLVIDKSAGIQVHPSPTEEKNTVVNWLLSKYPDIRTVGESPERPGIVHRLDKDTSGVMVIAKTQATFKALKTLFGERKVQKEYLAIVHGIPDPPEGEICLPIARSRSFRKQVIVRDGTRHKGQAREALTRYQVLHVFPSSIEGEARERFDKNRFPIQYSMLRVRPQTGRMHQIRIHLSTIGHPIVGDALYSRKEYPRPPHVKRFLLHAHTLSFSLRNKSHTFTAPPPKDFISFRHTPWY